MLKRLVALLMVALISLNSLGCDSNNMAVVSKPEANSISSKENTTKVIFPENIINISGNTAEEFVTSVKNDSKGDYKEIYVNDDGTVTMVLSADQKSKWLETREEGLESFKEQLEAKGKSYTMKWASDYTSVDVYYNLDLPTADAAIVILGGELMCAMYQMFNGTNPDAWTVELSVYNSDTLKLVKAANCPQEKLSYVDADWKASM